MPVSDHIKLQVQQATDLVELIGQDVRLTPKGRELVGLCPFHDDRSPSMNVSPGKQIYKCFACGAGGDAFSWMMNYHRMSFPEALRDLAKRAGIELEGAGVRDQGAGEEQQGLREANERAVQFYQRMLADPQQGRTARAYLEQRGVSREMQLQFQLGAAPDAWDALALAVQQKGWSARAFLDAGLIAPRKDSRDHFDRLRHRLIFPIGDAMGRPIAFGGRVLPDTQRDDKSDAKYLNSPETPLFAKARTLYGLHLAKNAMLKSRTAVVVEGYMDVIACHQHGFANVVAALGTAFTVEHARLLRRMVDRVVLVFDADEAGQRAAERAVEAMRVLMEAQLDVAVAAVPQGKDPDDLLRQPDGEAAWRRIIDEAPDAMSFQFERLAGHIDHEPTMAGRQRRLEQFAQSLALMGWGRQTPLRRAQIAQRFAQLAGLTEDEARRLLTQQRPTDKSPLPASSAADLSAPVELASNSTPHPWVNRCSSATMKGLAQAQRQVVGVLVRRPELFVTHRIDEALAPQEMIHPEARLVYEQLYEDLSNERPVSLNSLLARLSEHGHGSASAWLLDAEQVTADACRDRAEMHERWLLDGVAMIRQAHDQSQWDHTHDQLAQARQEAQLLEHVARATLGRPSPLRIFTPDTRN